MPEVKKKSGKIEKFAYTAKGKAAAKAAKSKMYQPPKGKKSPLQKMKAIAKRSLELKQTDEQSVIKMQLQESGVSQPEKIEIIK